MIVQKKEGKFHTSTFPSLHLTCCRVMTNMANLLRQYLKEFHRNQHNLSFGEEEMVKKYPNEDFYLSLSKLPETFVGFMQISKIICEHKSHENTLKNLSIIFAWIIPLILHQFFTQLLIHNELRNHSKFSSNSLPWHLIWIIRFFFFVKFSFMIFF